jgi:hypothetical protein
LQLFDEDHLAMGEWISKHTAPAAVIMHRCVVSGCVAGLPRRPEA